MRLKNFISTILFALIAFTISAQTNSGYYEKFRCHQFKIGASNSQKITRFDLTMPATPTNEGVMTSLAIRNYLNASFVPLGGTAGGDLSGTWPSPTVDGLQGVAVSAVAPTTGQVLKYNGTAWAAGAESDPSTTNELQTISTVTNSLTLSNGGGTITVDTDPANDLTGTGFGINSVFLTGAGSGANASYSLFLGADAGLNATDASKSNFFGRSAGSGATNATSSNFFGAFCGENAENAESSNFFGTNAGNGATNAASSNFFGANAGLTAIDATSANFFGTEAGMGATNAANSNFFGASSGTNATNAGNSNFFGFAAGQGSENATSSNFFGTETGGAAINAANSNFFGPGAGYGASDANDSNFFGNNSGSGAINASYSNFFGFNTGTADIGSNNIILGCNITLPASTADAINLGGVLFGTGTYNTTTGAQSATPTAAGKIGIGVVTPHASAKLEVSSTTGGVLFPRLTTTERNAIASPANGLMIYNSTTNKFQGYAGGAWVDFH